MHIIEIKENEFGTFDVLLNGCSYRVDRGLSREKAIERAQDAKAHFIQMGHRARIVGA